MHAIDFVVVGDLVADLILPVTRLPLRANEHDWADGLYPELGGACTTLVAARRLHLATATLGMVGGDHWGSEVLRMLAAEGVILEHAVAHPGRRTVLSVVITDKTGQHVFLGIKDHTPPERCPPDWAEVVPRARLLYTNGYALRDVIHPGDVLDLLRLGRQRGIPVFFDPGPSVRDIPAPMLEDALGLADVLVLTDDEAAHLVPGDPPAAGAALRAYGPSVVVVKVGAAGCHVASAAEPIHHPGFAVDVVDTVGAGDAFVAALAAGRLRGGSWRDCAALANAMGAAVVATQGAGRRVPGVERLVTLLGDDPAVRLLGQ